MTYQPIQKRNGNGRLRPTPKVSLGTPTAKLTSRKLGPTAQQELTQRTQELAQGEKILRHYIAHAQRTGQYNYPALVAHVLTAHTVATAPAGTRLLPKTINRLVSHSEQAVAKISTATESLATNLAALGESVSTDSMGINQGQVCREIKTSGQVIVKAIDELVTLAGEHGAPLTTEEGELVRILSSELQYFQHYLQNYAQPDKIIREFKAGESWELYSRRLNKYLGLLPGHALRLGDSVNATIQAKAPPSPSEPAV
jgi:hypothetical protein